jgi:toxin ParE1/3/4
VSLKGSANGSRDEGYILSPAHKPTSATSGITAPGIGARKRPTRYILTIRAACEALTANSKQGRAIDDIRPGYRKLAVESHFLFYRVTDTGLIDIIRILHQRMDVASHLHD